MQDILRYIIKRERRGSLTINVSLRRGPRQVFSELPPERDDRCAGREIVWGTLLCPSGQLLDLVASRLAIGHLRQGLNDLID